MNTKFDIKECIEKLSKRRDIFHSEADFQFALAWEIQREYPEADIRLEYCVKDVPKIHNEDGQNMHIDIMVSFDNDCKLSDKRWIPIELKYKTAKFVGTDIKDEPYDLKGHAAQLLGRYDFIKDIERLERLSNKSDFSYQEGYAIWLTNDMSYPRNKPEGKNNTICKEFSVHCGAIKKDTLKWLNDPSDGTIKNRKNPIKLKKEYEIKWHPYSSIETKDKNRKFDYSIVKV